MIDENKIKNELIVNLSAWKNRINKIMGDSILNMSHAESVEDLMEEKSNMLDRILADFCFGSDQCYFCLKHIVGLGCENCEWGKLNGICIRDNNLYKLMQNHISALRRDLFKYKKFENGE